MKTTGSTLARGESLDISSLLCQIERIKLSHDHMDWGSGFFVSEVEVRVPSHEEEYQFPCLCWLAQESDVDTTSIVEPAAPEPSEWIANA